MLRKNILANYLGAGVVALAPIIALPWYLAALGSQQYGLVAFIVMLQAVLGLLDAGLGQALVREFAIRLSSLNRDAGGASSLLFAFERLYWLFAFGVGCLTLLLADVIATHWLNLEALPATLGRQAIYGAAFIFVAQFPGSVYRSLLVGAQAQVTFNLIVFFGALARHGGGVLVVLAWPTLISLLIWHASIALLETLVRGRWAWRILNVKRSQAKWDGESLRPLWRLVVGMSGAAWLGALTVQMDKVILSKMATIEQFGFYTIAATVAIGMLQLVYPLIQATLPRVVQLRSEPIALRDLNIKLAGLIGLMAGLGGMVFMLAGKRLLGVWLQNSEAVAMVYPILAVLLLGTAMNAFYNIGYINWIAHEKISRVFQVNILALFLSVVLIPLFITWQGTVGAAFGWLTINLIGLIFSLEWLKRK